MIADKELKKEIDYLKSVLYTLDKEISKNSKKIKDLSEDLEDEMKYAWDATNRLSDTEFTYAIADIHRQSFTKNNTMDKLKSYKRMIKSAYFARFDFDDGDEVMPIYLGIATLVDGNYFYVYDWRAPICAMFYDFEPGDASYTTPSGDKISGKIVLKRQYKIEGDQIKEVFDTDMQVIDNILQKMLQENTSSKMKQIVNTIQRDQNKIIRKNDVDILVVNGPAGSGKTSVAMHKIAYLLYTYKDRINNSNVLILSPNDIFSNYISNVLPEIGEDNVYQTTFMDYIKTFLTEYKVQGSLNDIYEKIYSSDRSKIEYNSIKLKFSAVFIHLIENYLELIRPTLLELKDIVIDGKVVIEKDYLVKLASDLDFNGLSLIEQHKKLLEKILIHASIKTRKSQSSNAKLKKSISADKIKPKEIYNNLFSNRDRFVGLIEDIYNSTGTAKQDRLTIKELDDIFAYTSANLSKGIIPYEDVSGYLYLKNRLVGSINQNSIKFIVIDEAQDYSLMQYKILASLFKNANISIMGDINQCIMPFSAYKNYDSVINVLSEFRDKVRTESVYLSKTYRSTTEINTFAKTIIPDSPLYNQIERHGDDVVVEKLPKKSAEFLVSEAIKLKKKYNLVAIITKNQAQADKFKEYITLNKKSNLVKVISKKDKTFVSDKVIIIPSYLAKGLEFDAVLVADASKKNYSIQEKNLFYVVCTRALHKLNIYYSDELTDLIKTQNN